MPFNIQIIITISVIIFLGGLFAYKQHEINGLEENNAILIKNQETLKLSNQVLENAIKESNANKEILVSEYDKKILDVKETYIIIEKERENTEKIVEKVNKIDVKSNGYQKFFEDLSKLEEGE